MKEIKIIQRNTLIMFIVCFCPDVALGLRGLRTFWAFCGSCRRRSTVVCFWTAFLPGVPLYLRSFWACEGACCGRLPFVCLFGLLSWGCIVGARLLGARGRLLWTALRGLSSAGFRPVACPWRRSVVDFGLPLGLVSRITSAPLGQVGASIVACPPLSVFDGFTLVSCFPAPEAPIVAVPPPSLLAPVSRLAYASSGLPLALVSRFTSVPLGLAGAPIVACPPLYVFDGFTLVSCFPASGEPIVAVPLPSLLAPVSRLAYASCGRSVAHVWDGFPWSLFTDIFAPRVVTVHPWPVAFAVAARAPRVSCTPTDGRDCPSWMAAPGVCLGLLALVSCFAGSLLGSRGRLSLTPAPGVFADQARLALFGCWPFGFLGAPFVGGVLLSAIPSRRRALPGAHVLVAHR